MTKIVLIHAYSATNSGDGLLVDEAYALALDAFPESTIMVVALDPESFDSQRFGTVIHPLTGRSRSIGNASTLLHALFAVARGSRPARSVQAAIAAADVVLAVGGGYLRAGSPIEALKMMLTHFPLLPRSNRNTPHLYLSQSVGPLRLGTAAAVRRRLSHAHSIAVRDGRSSSELASLGDTVARLPDLALLGLSAIGSPKTLPVGRGIGLVARELGSTRSRVKGYRSRIATLGEREDVEFLVQADGRGNDDTAFYRSLGQHQNMRSLAQSTHHEAKERPSVVISVRLHGAIQSIRNGVPAIHLSYERKGWGAFEDMGVSRFVHNAFDFDEDLVLRQVEELRDDATEYWKRILASLPALTGGRSRVVEMIRDGAR